MSTRDTDRPPARNRAPADAPKSAPKAAPSWAATGVSIANGLFGDFLRQRNNPLEIDMCFVSAGRPLSMSPVTLRAAHPVPQRKLSVSIHGLCCSERSWEIPERKRGVTPDTYGGLLEAELGYTAFYLRYNSGVSIAQNGKRLAGLLQQLVDAYDVENTSCIDEIILLGHSMGGLVIRSACEHGLAHQQSWVTRVTRIFYLGTPHHGADLEKIASMADATLAALPNSIARLVAQVVGIRSSGIKGLQHGLSPESWLASAQHYLIAGTLGDDPRGTPSRALGDALVRVPNATAEGVLPTAQRRVFAGIHHMRLAHDRRVYQQIKAWCQTE